MINKYWKHITLIVIISVIIIVVSILITFPKNPIVQFKYEIGGETGESISFIAKVKDGILPYNVSFYFGDGSYPIRISSNKTTFSVNHTYEDFGKYTLSVVAKDSEIKTVDF